MKGLVETIAEEIGLKKLTFKQLSKGGLGADVYLGKDRLGEIEVLDKHIISTELNFEFMVQHATLKKTYAPLAKYPPIVEDISVVVDNIVSTGDIIEDIQKVSDLIVEISLLDQYENSRTFHIVYQDVGKNLTNDEVTEVREKVIKMLESNFAAKIK